MSHQKTWRLEENVIDISRAEKTVNQEFYTQQKYPSRIKRKSRHSLMKEN